MYKLVTSIQGRAYDKALVALVGPAHLAGKPNGLLAATIMAQMYLSICEQKTLLRGALLEGNA